MNTSLLLPAAAAVCAVLILLIARQLFIRAPPRPDFVERKSPSPSPVPSDVEKDIKADIIEDVWPRHELPRPDEAPAPTLGSLPDVALVWGVDYSFNTQPSMAAVDRRPLMAYSHIASALGVDEPEPVTRARSFSATSSSVSTTTDTRPMRSRSLISGIVSDWNSLSQSEQEAWATLSEARASRTRSGTTTPRAYS